MTSASICVKSSLRRTLAESCTAGTCHLVASAASWSDWEVNTCRTGKESIFILLYLPITLLWHIYRLWRHFCTWPVGYINLALVNKYRTVHTGRQCWVTSNSPLSVHFAALKTMLCDQQLSSLCAFRCIKDNVVWPATVFCLYISLN